MAKAKQPLVVGHWVEGVTFEADEIQPTTPITDMAAMIAWVKSTFSDQPGTYEFVRKVPGAFIATQQIEFAFVD